MTALNNVGFYGKIPTTGDFVSRHLPRTFIEPWDQWLQESIAASREQLGDHWLNSYLTGPIWRFALSKGVCSNTAWIGLMMPSVDQVGRYFPLTLAIPVSDNDSCRLLFIADQEASWFAQAEDIALSALDQNNNLDSLIQGIDNLGVPSGLSINETRQDEVADPSTIQPILIPMPSPMPSPMPNAVPSAGAMPKGAMPKSSAMPKPNLANSDNWRIGMSVSGPVSANLTPLMEQFLQQRFPDFTLWWTSGSEQVEPSILICDNLPPTQGFSALLTGNWGHWGWDNKLNSAPPIPKVDNENTPVATS